MQNVLNIDSELWDEFCAYHQANPLIWKLFQRFAEEIRAKRTRYGAKSLMERIRWEIDLATPAALEFKINNNYTSLYARMLAHKFPDRFSDFFEFRELTREANAEKSKDLPGTFKLQTQVAG